MEVWELEGNYTTAEELAFATGVNVSTIKRRCYSGDLKAEKIGRIWLIKVETPVKVA